MEKSEEKHHRSEWKRAKENYQKTNKNAVTIMAGSDVAGVNETKANSSGKSGQKNYKATDVME